VSERVFVEWDEWWPVYGLTDDLLAGCDVEVEFPTETVERIRAAFGEFNEVQTILRDAVEKVRGARR